MTMPSLASSFAYGGKLLLHISVPTNLIWIAATVVAGLLTFGVHRWRVGAHRLLSGDDPTTRMLRRLLLASALIPFATDEMLSLGSRMGLLNPSLHAIAHTLSVALLLLLIILSAASSLQQSDLLRLDALDRLRNSEERLRLQIDSMPLACITFSTQFRITGWNPAAQRMFGWTAEEVMEKDAGILLPGESIPDLDSLWQRVLEGSPQQSVNRNRSKDGRIILCSWYNTPLIDRNGEVLGVVAMARDLTAEERAQNDLRQAERQHRELVDSLPHPVFSFDEQGRYTAVNAATCRFHGLDKEQLLGKSAVEVGVVPPDIVEEWRKDREQCIAADRTLVFERRLPIRGELRQYQSILTPIHSESGEIVGVTGIAIDTSEQRRAEDTARELLSAVEQLDEVIFTTDRDGLITYVNPAFERTYGYRYAEAVGQTPRILKSGDLSPKVAGYLWSELLSGQSVRGEYRNRRKDGTLVDVVASASPLFDDQNGVRGFVAVQRDVSKQRRADEERRLLDERLGQLDKMEALGTLAGGIAHDFNNLLSIVLSHTTLIGRLESQDPRIARATETIKKAVHRGAALSRQILTFARRSEITRNPIDLAQLILELGPMISETFPRTIELTIELDPDLPPIEGDSGQIHQALLNLCVNARDAMPDGGSLVIDARPISSSAQSRTLNGAPPGDYVCISVSDTGSGIDPAARERIFDPFFTTKEVGKGTGLGLALVYGIVTAHEGLTEVDSELGKGTQFRLYFPARPGAEVLQNAAPLSTTSSGAGQTILLIDDEAGILEALSEYLDFQGYRVISAANGPEALGVIECAEVQPQLVLMDLGMPKMSAPDLIGELRKRLPEVGILAMTGYVDPAVHASVRQAGVDQLIQKPFSMDDLLGELRKLQERGGPPDVPCALPSLADLDLAAPVS